MKEAIVFLISKRISIIVIIFILFFFVANFSYCAAQSDQTEDTVYTKEFGIFTGWASGDLKRQQGDYNTIPLHLQFGFDITSLLDKINIRQKGSLKFVLEPFLNTIVSPDSNIEVGTDFLLKYSHPLTQRFYIYFEAGAGMMFTSQHTFEQSTQFNFTEQAGGGISYLFTENKAINFGYRYRHFSNAGIDEPNRGIEMDYFLCGITVSY